MTHRKVSSSLPDSLRNRVLFCTNIFLKYEQEHKEEQELKFGKPTLCLLNNSCCHI